MFEEQVPQCILTCSFGEIFCLWLLTSVWENRSKKQASLYIKRFDWLLFYRWSFSFLIRFTFNEITLYETGSFHTLQLINYVFIFRSTNQWILKPASYLDKFQLNLSWGVIFFMKIIARKTLSKHDRLYITSYFSDVRVNPRAKFCLRKIGRSLGDVCRAVWIYHRKACKNWNYVALQGNTNLNADSN